MIQYLNIIVERKNDNNTVFLSYIVEDQADIFVKSDILLKASDDDSTILYLIHLLRKNANMINDFKFNIGNFSIYDMQVDPWPFVKDIKNAVLQFNTEFAKIAVNYIEIYQELIDHIVDVEETVNIFTPKQRRKYCTQLIDDFTYVTYDAYLNNSVIIYSGTYNSDVLEQLQVQGLSLSEN